MAVTAAAGAELGGHFYASLEVRQPLGYHLLISSARRHECGHDHHAEDEEV